MPASDPDVSRPRLIRDAGFTGADPPGIARCRGQRNRPGSAWQIAFVRVLGRFPRQSPLEMEEDILRFAALQLRTEPEVIQDHSRRRRTVSGHQRHISRYLRLHLFDAVAGGRLAEFPGTEALRLDRTASLLARARTWPRDGRIPPPAGSVLHRAAGSARHKARGLLDQQMATRLTPSMRERPDAPPAAADDHSRSRLHHIRANPSGPSTAGTERLPEKLDMIEANYGPEIDASWINGNHQRVPFHSVRSASADRMRGMAAPRRCPALVCLPHQARRDTPDQAVDMYGRLLDRNRRKTGPRLDGRLRARRRAIDRVVHRYRRPGAVPPDPDVCDAELRTRLLETVPAVDLREDRTDPANWTAGDGRARSAAPFPGRMEFVDGNAAAASPTPAALRAYRECRDAGQRSLPQDVPPGSASETVRPLLRRNGVIDRRRWESALFNRAQDEIRAGNLAMDGGRNPGRFEAFFLPDGQWDQVRGTFRTRTGFPGDPGLAAEHLKTRLSEAFDHFPEGVTDNRQVTSDDRGWRLGKDPAERLGPARSRDLAELRRWLDARSRTIRLADLLIEAGNGLGFSARFHRPGGKRVEPNGVCALPAGIPAHGCNLGLPTMEGIAPGIPYASLRHVSDRRLLERNQRTALAGIVHGISRLDAASHRGDGTASAGDGQCFAMRQKVPQRTYSTRFNDFAPGFQSFVADSHAPFHSRPIECTDRDAPSVPDGVPCHESDLDLQEHHSDSHGYTGISFAASAMIAMRFCPHIRNLHRQRIHCADPARDHGVLEPVPRRGRRAVNFDPVAGQWNRIGQFHAAFPAGHTTASAALQRPSRFQPSNRFHPTNREPGLALKTEFVPRYMSEPQLRARVRRGLLKVEQLHTLVRTDHRGQGISAIRPFPPLGLRPRCGNGRWCTTEWKWGWKWSGCPCR